MSTRLAQRLPAERRRTTLVGLMLVCSLVPTILLAWQAIEAAGSHRASAESVVRDYAGIAARSFSDQAAYQFGTRVINKAVIAVREAMHKSGPLELPGRARWHPRRAGKDTADLHDMLRTLFCLDRESGRLSLGDADMPDAEQALMKRELLAHAGANAEDGRDYRVFITHAGALPRMFVYGIEREGADAGKLLFGFEVRTAGLQNLFRRILETEPLLPKLLAGRGKEASVAIHVLRPDGGSAWTGGVSGSDAISNRAAAQEWLGGLQVEASIPARAASSLVIGGLPSSRLPEILAVLAVAVLLVGATLFILRRQQQLTRLRSDFVSSVSHELRTPLSQIRLFSETLLLGRVRSRSEGRRSLQIIDQEARRLSHLVENILQFSRTERGALRVQLERLDLLEVTVRVLDAFEPLAAAGRVRLHRILEPVPEITSDTEALRRILLNLLDNAVKYGPRGQTVTVRLVSGRSRVSLVVEDEGPGIPDAERDRVWQKYWRSPSTAGSATAGTGIGLYLVHETVELLGGRVFVGNLKAGGCRFAVHLPVKAACQASRTTADKVVAGVEQSNGQGSS